jgi:hypothetical protein
MQGGHKYQLVLVDEVFPSLGVVATLVPAHIDYQASYRMPPDVFPKPFGLRLQVSIGAEIHINRFRVSQGRKSKRITLQGRGHTEWTDCVATLYEKFIRAGDESGLPKDECSTPTRPPFRRN